MRIKGNGETFLEIAILTAVRVRDASEIIKGKKNPKQKQNTHTPKNPQKPKPTAILEYLSIDARSSINFNSPLK